MFVCQAREEEVAQKQCEMEVLRASGDQPAAAHAQRLLPQLEQVTHYTYYIRTSYLSVPPL